ncbi:MAG: EscU/YscU/HrcU family type III secretion system export apparatus switch protein [Cellvibrionaceae bacterium]|nr:EscU/YscU/HrcU family type III secretion system export apparatus switch protein [Cellvibrionaceae bacterium]
MNSPDLSKAIALFYDGESAPTVTAKGCGLAADDIVALAMENDVPLCENAPLAELLCQLEIGDHIPENLYIAVAHIIAFAYDLKIQSTKLENPEKR